MMREKLWVVYNIQYFSLELTWGYYSAVVSVEGKNKRHAECRFPIYIKCKHLIYILYYAVNSYHMYSIKYYIGPVDYI